MIVLPTLDFLVGCFFSRCISPIIIYPIYGYNNDTIGCLTSDEFVGSNMFNVQDDWHDHANSYFKKLGKSSS